MKNNTRTRTLISLLLAISLLSLPITAFAKKGDSNFKRGKDYEQKQQWELIGQGVGIHWEAIDEDISVAGLLGLPND